jgi:hypothetical protein
MDGLKPLFALAALALVTAVCAHGQAPTAKENVPIATKVKVRQPFVPPAPFSIDATADRKTPLVEFLSLNQMTARDREQAANAESSIGEHVGHVGLEFNEGQWSYEQVVCPALPNHIFLRFLRNNGKGDVSVFTASIPRGDEGRVRIIPIQLRSYSLWSPAPINALTISAFNHIRAEDNPDRAPVADWLGTAFCYAALAGGQPKEAVVNQEPPTDKFPVANKASLAIPDKGGAILSFSDVSASPKSMTWTMSFDGKGKLLKATHTPAELVPINWVHPAKVDQKTRQLLGTEPAVETRPTPPAPPVATDHPAAPVATTLTPAQTANAQ